MWRNSAVFSMIPVGSGSIVAVGNDGGLVVAVGVDSASVIVLVQAAVQLSS